MSWGEYLNNLKAEGLKHAAICGLDGSWVQASEGSEITQDEVKSFLGSMGNVEALAESGIRIGGEKYMYISGTDTICRGKKGQGGIHMAKSNTTLVIGIYDENVQPGQVAIVVEKMADYLSGQNY